MRTPIALITLPLLAFLLSPALAADQPLPTAEQLLAKVTASIAKLTSFQADGRMTVQGPIVSTTTMRLVLEKSEKEGKTLVRGLLTSKTTKKSPDGEDLTNQVKTILDGTSCWDELRSSGRTGIEVTKYDAQDPEVPKMTDMIAGMLTQDAMARFSLTTVGEDTIEGRKMYLLDATCSPEYLEKHRMKEYKAKVWVAQDNLIPCRQVTITQRADQDQPRVQTDEFHNVKLNEKIDPALFTYTPPPGATIIDQTKPKP